MRKTIVKIAIVMMLIAVVYPLKSQAALQANKNGKSIKTGDVNSGVIISANDLFTGIRAMEEGTLGRKKDEVDGLDCHMAKNTEWGTIAMLSASVYGTAPNGVNVNATTTGNESGIKQMADGRGYDTSSKGYELVAGIWDTANTYTRAIKSADPKYYDLYSSRTSIPGDATTETAEWKKATYYQFVSANYPIFGRGWEGIFGYNGHNGFNIEGGYNSLYAGARAVVVCGEGL